MMLRLRTFGGLALVDASGFAAIHQRRRLGLLAVLALAGEAGVSRDRLRLLFWPESTDENARHGLDQLLYAVRRQVGDDVFLGVEPVRLNPAVISSDVACFKDALARDDLAEAVALYDGPFADGFYIRDAPDFERWTAQQRDCLSREFRTALDHLAEQMSRAGHSSEEIALRRRLVAADPLDERATVALVRALALSGERTEALRHVRMYETLTRDELGFAPDPMLVALLTDLITPRGVAGNGADTAVVHTNAAPPAVDGRSWRRFSTRMRLIGGSVAIVSALIVVAIGAVRGRRPDRLALAVDGASAVLVAPFRVTGADSSLGYLSEGMVDLLAVTLTGEAGPRAVDPRTTLSHWRRVRGLSDGDPSVGELLRTARQLRASQLMLGEVVGVPAHLIVSASVIRVTDGSIVTRVRLEGPQDSLGAIVDALTARVLTSTASRRSASELSASLPALRAYLRGEAAYRSGRYTEAVESFQRAVDLDSTFAIAALGLATSVGWTPSAEDDEPGIQLAWSLRDRLSPKDRALLDARVGLPPLGAASTRDKLVDKELATRLAPDRAETWFWLADDLYHEGALVGDAHARARSMSLFRRALELDSSSAPLGHLVELAALSGDTTEAVRLGALFLRSDSTSDWADAIRWRLAIATGDVRALAQLRRRFADMKTTSLLHMLVPMQHDGVGLEDVDRVVAALERSARRLGRAEQRAVWIALWELALNRGRPLDVLAAARMWRAASPDNGSPQDREYHERLIGDALFADGDSAFAEGSARELARYGTMSQSSSGSRVASSVCAVQLWRTSKADTRETGQAIQFLRGVAAHRDSAAISSQSLLCAEILQVMIDAQRHPARGADQVSRLDSLLQTGPFAFPVMHTEGANLAIIGPLIAQGNPRAALAASRRHLYGRGPTRMLAALLVHEARLSSITGDTAGAVKAYRHYLALRQNAEPSRRGQVDQMRSELARLQRIP